MARIRTIKPEFWESETIASLSRDARLLFICCLNLADDEGRLRWTSAYLKSSAFMYDDDLLTESLTELMHELLTAGLIRSYKAGKLNACFAHIVSFKEHQRINRPTPSKIPAPTFSVYENRLQDIDYTKENKITDSLTESISEPHSESLTVGKEGKGRERKGKEGKGTRSPSHDGALLL